MHHPALWRDGRLATLQLLVLFAGRQTQGCALDRIDSVSTSKTQEARNVEREEATHAHKHNCVCQCEREERERAECVR